jgi:septal ring factor EnvC (AmiA/AmiB activator)
MSDNETPEVTPAPAPEAPKPAAPSNDLPDWAREEISKANQEAATNRVKLREEKKQREALEEQLAALATEKSSAASSLSSVQSDFDKLVTAIRAEVPHDKVFAFAKTLQGSNEDELSAHAAELKSMFGISQGPARAVDRSQGKGSDPDAKVNPAEAFASLIQAQLSR